MFDDLGIYFGDFEVQYPNDAEELGRECLISTRYVGDLPLVVSWLVGEYAGDAKPPPQYAGDLSELGYPAVPGVIAPMFIDAPQLGDWPIAAGVN